MGIRQYCNHDIAALHGLHRAGTGYCSVLFCFCQCFGDDIVSPDSIAAAEDPRRHTFAHRADTDKSYRVHNSLRISFFQNDGSCLSALNLCAKCCLYTVY